MAVNKKAVAKKKVVDKKKAGKEGGKDKFMAMIAAKKKKAKGKK